MTNIKEQLLTFDTVDEIVEVRRECKSRNGSVYVIKLWSEVGIYEFKNEMNEIDDLKNYIILTQIPGFEDEYEYIGIVDGVRDLTDWAFRNLDFPKGTKMSTIAIGCTGIVNDIKECFASIIYNEWIKYSPSSEQIIKRSDYVTNNENCNESYNNCLDSLQNKLLSYGYTKWDGTNNITGTYSLKGKNGNTIFVGLGVVDKNSVLIQINNKNGKKLMQTEYDCNDEEKMKNTIFNKSWINTNINEQRTYIPLSDSFIKKYTNNILKENESQQIFYRTFYAWGEKYTPVTINGKTQNRNCTLTKDKTIELQDVTITIGDKQPKKIGNCTLYCIGNTYFELSYEEDGDSRAIRLTLNPI